MKKIRDEKGREDEDKSMRKRIRLKKMSKKRRRRWMMRRSWNRRMRMGGAVAGSR